MCLFGSETDSRGAFMILYFNSQQGSMFLIGPCLMKKCDLGKL